MKNGPSALLHKALGYSQIHWRKQIQCSQLREPRDVGPGKGKRQVNGEASYRCPSVVAALKQVGLFVWKRDALEGENHAFICTTERNEEREREIEKEEEEREYERERFRVGDRLTGTGKTTGGKNSMKETKEREREMKGSEKESERHKERERDRERAKEREGTCCEEIGTTGRQEGRAAVMFAWAG